VKKSKLAAVNYCEEKIITCDYSKETLNVFAEKTMKLMSTLDISESVGYFYVCGIVSCSDTMHLFLANHCIHIWRVDISSIHNMNINIFVRHKDEVTSMSLTRRRLIVTPRYNKDEVYSLVVYDVVSGKRLQSVQLPSFMDPTHSIETTNNVFIVSHRDRVSRDQYGVSEVNSEGHVTRAFNGLLNNPCYLTLDSLGRVLFIDMKYNVLLLSEELKYERVLVDIQQLVDKQTTTQSSRTISPSRPIMCGDKTRWLSVVVNYKENIDNEIIVLKY